MKVKHRNVMLPVDMLRPHPDNPRKDIGDVTELADSIRANGIFQNLTVLFDVEDDEDGYTVLIGHRRLAAAKLAGLTEVPCMVVEMDKREQVSTMLLENMQRSDLTVYEQAQGFQMMLDLGETKDDIAEKTGFSCKTINHRLKLLELDPEEFRKAQERQATLSDYIELERISDPVLKNKALEKIGTADFKWTVDLAIRKEKNQRNKTEWLEYLPTIAEKINPALKQDLRFLKPIYICNELTDKQKDELEQMSKEDELRYTIENNDYVYFYGKREEEQPGEPDPAEEERRLRRDERARRITELEAQAAASRKEFVKQFSNRRHISYLTAEFLKDPDIEDIDYEQVAEMLGIEYEENEDDWNTVEVIIRSEDYEEYANYCPHQLMLAMLSTIHEDRNKASLHDLSMKYVRNSKLERWYEILETVGYKVSKDEKKLLSGEYECFEDIDKED